MAKPAAAALLAVLLVYGCGTDGPPPAPPPEGRPRLSCRIDGPATLVGGEGPDLRVTLVNESGEALVLAGALDGSDCGMRYPHCLFEITGPDGTPTHRDPPRCGNSNFLRPGDFATVPPGGTFDPFRGMGRFPSARLRPESFPVPGEYRIRFVYDTACDDIARWDGGPAWEGYRRKAGVEDLWRRVPRLRVVSPEFLLTVVR